VRCTLHTGRCWWSRRRPPGSCVGVSRLHALEHLVVGGACHLGPGQLDGLQAKGHRWSGPGTAGGGVNGSGRWARVGPDRIGRSVRPQTTSVAHPPPGMEQARTPAATRRQAVWVAQRWGDASWEGMQEIGRNAGAWSMRARPVGGLRSSKPSSLAVPTRTAALCAGVWTLGARIHRAGTGLYLPACFLKCSTMAATASEEPPARARSRQSPARPPAQPAATVATAPACEADCAREIAFEGKMETPCPWATEPTAVATRATS